MNTTKKIALGLSLAAGAAVAAWLLTGKRKEKTKNYIAEKASTLKSSLKKEGVAKKKFDDTDAHYV